ncbi:N,N-dimethylformamidase beta subunit family domain-containing protein [Bosea sp. PAMC 26642]|uniref:N,N-dimethylformamidase beta subunit family domain-containing protein n=1 Tax=Bosea sp. (strain PAMC 26642) TaxID=1792307 RepID=UPI00076FE193|nr:N,N-dimethylformamidase beta subunit family domain-containing protein [Bosea sp. PAMC 26642]AMJ59750.1 N,N-dimethylformamidase [Bosea sp. PAMC 26642]
MLPITGYVDRWSVRPGEELSVMVAVEGGGRYGARVARVICGDPNPQGPGYREVPVAWELEGEHEGEERLIARGSWVDIPELDLGSGRSVAFCATIWPTLLSAGKQAVLNWNNRGATLTLGITPDGAFCRLVAPGGTTLTTTGVALTERAWHDIACLYDPATGALSIAQSPRKPRLDHDERAERGSIAAMVVLSGPGAVTIAAERSGTHTVCHFNGKIERPRIIDGAAGLAAILTAQARDEVRSDAKIVAEWDFSLAISSDDVCDIGPAQAHGRCINLPTRAMTGSLWTGASHRWTEDPRQWAAIHFHNDDIGDAAWPVSLRFTVPEDWSSGVYALHLDKGGARDNIVFYVRAAVPGSQAKVAFLAPTFSYTVYGQFQKEGRQALITERSLAWGALPQAPDGHPDYGVSPYNFHSDGSGVVMSTMRRPLIDKRVNQIHLVDPSPEGSGLYWIAADSAITDMLTRKGIPFEVITDHDLHEEGHGLLSNYNVVLTGQHPEYHTTQTLDALGTYLEGGGRFVYLGGNGFYWKVVPHSKGPWAFELRRAEGGIRLWETLPGESYHAFDGSYGGLWRRLGRPPQALVGVGFSTQGDYKGFPYSFLDGILDPRVAFMREGLTDEARPGGILGERGLMGGGAAGHELDRADTRLGTPAHAIIVGSAVLDDPSYQPVNEERFDHTWPEAREKIIRSDLTFFETANGGAVFSVGSMNFIGALPIDGYENVAARLVTNVIRRFADPEPFPPPFADRPGHR